MRFIIFVAFLGTFSQSFAQTGIYFPPSDLTKCHTRGWILKRLGTTESLEFPKLNETCAAKFTIKPDHERISEGWRAEIEDPLRLPPKAVMTYEFSTYIPSILKGSDVPNLVFAQWHDLAKPTFNALRPPVSLRLRDGNITIPIFNETVLARQGLNGPGMTLYSKPALFDQWIQWRFRIYWQANDKGFLEVWMNDKKIVQYQGALSYATDLTAPYFKLGIYTTAPFDKPLWVYHTNYRRSYLVRTRFDLKPRDGGR